VRLLFAGRVVELKGPQHAVEALAIVRRSKKHCLRVSLTIVGDCQDARFLQLLHENTKKLGCEDAVRFNEPVSERALLSVFNDHDIYIFPSLYEPFSLTLIHALDAGIPTVASSAGGNSEIISHGQTGLLFEKGRPEDLANRILDLIGNPNLRADLVMAGRRAARRFTLERMVDRIELALLWSI
jgi:glycosyltransferase involved in cell wall biosynthesis